MSWIMDHIAPVIAMNYNYAKGKCWNGNNSYLLSQKKSTSYLIAILKRQSFRIRFGFVCVYYVTWHIHTMFVSRKNFFSQKRALQRIV